MTVSAIANRVDAPVRVSVALAGPCDHDFRRFESVEK
jgi:hypothetical protein